MMRTLYTGKRMRLRRADGRDVESLTRWMRHEDFCAFLYGSPLDPQMAVQRRVEENLTADLGPCPTRLIVIAETIGGEPFGVILISDIDWKNRHLIAELMVGEDRFRGRTYGLEMYVGLGHIAFGWLNMHKIMGFVYAFNETSLAIMERSGARREGVLRGERFRGGRWHDTHVYGITRDEFTAAMARHRASRIGRRVLS